MMGKSTARGNRLRNAGIAAALALAAFALFWISRSTLTSPPNEERRVLTKELAVALDKEVDTVLSRCRIERQWIRKLNVEPAGAAAGFIERRVVIPEDVLPVHVNVAMNVMARRYNAQVIAYENIKDNTVSLHIEYGKQVIQKIILKFNNSLKRRGKNVSPTT